MHRHQHPVAGELRIRPDMVGAELHRQFVAAGRGLGRMAAGAAMGDDAAATHGTDQRPGVNQTPPQVSAIAGIADRSGENPLENRLRGGTIYRLETTLGPERRSRSIGSGDMAGMRNRAARALAVSFLTAAAVGGMSVAARADVTFRQQSSSRFTVEIPTHWTITQRDDDATEVTFRVEDDIAGRTAAACQFRAVDTAGLFAGRSAIEIEKTRDYAISPAGMKMGLPEDERGLEWGATDMSGEPAGLVVTQTPDANVRRLSVMALTEKASYFVVCSTHADAFDQRRATFERIIGSFVILE